MLTRETFLTSILSFEGTPYGHMGRTKGSEIDCIGLITCALAECGEDMSYIPRHYSRRPHKDNVLLQCLQESPHVYEIHTENLEPGDILTFKIGQLPHHFGVYLGDDEMIHSYYKQSVIRTSLSAWQLNLDTVWRLYFEDEI